MARESSPEIDDELFNDIYGKAYTGPVKPTANSTAPSGNNNNATKRPPPVNLVHGSDEEDGLKESNAIPTDFTSRDARVWEAKAKATERNWNRRQQEEMICKLCGDPSHYTQGCPSTLGTNKKTSEFFQRVAARDPQVRALFPPKVISKIENELGCKITMNEKFLFVSAKEQPSFLSKGIDRIHEMIQAVKERSSNGSPRAARSRSPPSSPRVRVSSPSRSRDRSPKGGRGLSPPRRERSGSQRLYSPRNERPRSYGERSIGDHSRENSYRWSPHDYPKYGGSSTQGRSRSPTRRPQYPPSEAPYNRQQYGGGQNRNYEAPVPAHKISGWDVEGQRITDPGRAWDPKAGYPRTLEELEMEFKREAMEMTRACDQEVDEENYKHREKIREMRESYTSKLSTLRNAHSKQWDDFLLQQHSIIARQPPCQPPPPPPPQGGSYPPPNAYTDPTDPRTNSQYVGPACQSMYPYGVDGTNNYSAAAPRPHYGQY